MLLDELLRTKKRTMRDLSAADLLSLMGLERRHTAFENALPTSIAFVAGLAAGAGIALLLAPKTGSEMRKEISSRASELSHRIGSAASELASEARNALSSSTSSTTTAPAERTETTRALSGTNRTS